MAKPTTRAPRAADVGAAASARRPPNSGATSGAKGDSKHNSTGTPTVAHRPFAKLAKARKAALPGKAAEAPTSPDPKAALLADAESERLRFARMMRGVRPLAGVRAPAAEASSQEVGTRTTTRREMVADPDAEARAKLVALVAEGVRFEVLDDGEALEGRRLDVDPSEIRKLRQLRYAVDGTLDLHGLDATSARAKLEAFLRRRRLQGDRAVLVVHGKGSHSPRGSPVLRGEIGAWLSQGKAQRDVAAFSSVQDRSGDSGAVFVLLSR